MKQALYNQRGSVLMMSLLVLVVLGGMLAAASPMIVNEVKMNTVNRDMIDAQFAAEAGAKVGIAAVYAKNTDWSWLGKARNLVDGNATRTYSVTISPALGNAEPVPGQEYTITSTGIVNGTAVKKVVVKVKAGGASLGVFANSSYSNGAMRIISGSVTGDIASNSLITIGNGMTVNGNATYVASKFTKKQIDDLDSKSGNIASVSSAGTLDVPAMMQSAPAMPTFTMTGTVLPLSNSALTGAYNYVNNPNSGKYYNDGNYNNWTNSYTVASNQSVFIYVKGDFTIGKPITGGGNITIYATGNLTVHEDIVGNIVNLYAGNTITLYQSTKAIRGNSITLQSAGKFDISGGNVIANTGGNINVYSGGELDLGAGSVTGSVVTMIAKTAKTGLHGTDINKGQPNYITKIYIDGDVDMASGTVGGLSMIVSNGSIDLHGTQSNALLIATGDIEAESGSSGGLYANGTVYIHGASVTFPSLTDVATLVSGSSSSKMSILSWGSL